MFRKISTFSPLHTVIIINIETNVCYWKYSKHLNKNLLINGMLITKNTYNYHYSLDPLYNEAKKCNCYKYVNKKMVKKVLNAKQYFSRIHRHILRSTDLKKLSTPMPSFRRKIITKCNLSN
jgi:hypothetical protein